MGRKRVEGKVRREKGEKEEDRGKKQRRNAIIVFIRSVFRLGHSSVGLSRGLVRIELQYVELEINFIWAS